MPGPPSLSCCRPAPGILLVAGGLPPPPGGMAQRRVEALLPGAPAAPPAQPAELAAAREVTLLPMSGAQTQSLVERLARVRGVAPRAVIRLEVWLEAPAAPELDAALVDALAAAQPLFVHAMLTQAELPPGTDALFRCLANAGVPAAAELVLRRGGIDSTSAVRALCLGLLRLGVRPFYLVDGAWLAVEERVPRAEALEIVRALRGWISGLAVPQLVEERCDGRRMLAIPPYVERLDESGVEVVNYEGWRLRYANPPTTPG